ncbi:MAG: hypothetical protein IH853_13175 [Bacteroidetes bacterium]|nr:hypothetical protein [Bacteroidota bacterium]
MRIKTFPEPVEQAVEAFLFTRANLSPQSIQKNSSVLGQFVAFLGTEQLVCQIGTDQIQTFLFARERQPVTRKTYSTTLSPFFNWLIENGAISHNPVLNVRLERVPTKLPRDRISSRLALEHSLRCIEKVRNGSQG